MSDLTNAPGDDAGGQHPASPFAAPNPATVVVPTQMPKPRRSRGAVIGSVAAVAVLLGGGVFAIAQIGGNDDSGGASSPTELGEKLVATLNDEDLLGALDLLLPGERETFRQPMLDLVDELTRLEVTDDSADLGDLAGIDIEIDEPDIDIDETNVADITNVSVVADSVVTVDGEELPIGDLLIERAFEGDRPQIDDSDDSPFDVTFTAVEEDDRWYISLFHSIAESERGDADIPTDGIEAHGADSPEGAIEDMIDAAVAMDFEAVIAGLNPNEAQALQRYAPIFLAEAEDLADQTGASIEVEDVTFDVAGDGDRRQVAITGFLITAEVEGESVEVELRDGCIIATMGPETVDTCETEELEMGLEQLEQLGPAFSGVVDLIEDLQSSFDDVDFHGVVVDRVDGEWYVSPIGTMSELGLSGLRALDRDEIENLIDGFEDLANSGLLDAMG